MLPDCPAVPVAMFIIMVGCANNPNELIFPTLLHHSIHSCLTTLSTLAPPLRMQPHLSLSSWTRFHHSERLEMMAMRVSNSDEQGQVHSPSLIYFLHSLLVLASLHPSQPCLFQTP